MKHRNPILWVALGLALLASPLLAQMQQQEPKKLTVEAIYRKLNFYRQLPSGLRWLPRSDRFSYLKRNEKNHSQELWVQEAKNGKEKPVVSSQALRYVREPGDTVQVSLFRYQWLPDESGLLLVSDGDLWLYRLKEKQLKPLTHTEASEEQVQLSPRGRFVSFVRDYNLYAIDLSTGQEIQLTSDGHKDLLNGKLDWVYQEELVGRGNFRGYFWSPDERHIAYLQFDESPVPQYPLVDWSPYHPDLEMMRYPKAGDPNPVVRLGVVDLQTRQTRWLANTGEDDSYIPRVYWLPDGHALAYIHLDRLQQHLAFRLVDLNSGQTRTLLSEQDDAWLNIGDFVYFFKKKPWFIWGSERTGFRHLYLYDTSGKLVRTLTSGDWMVDRLLKVDEKRGWVYYTSTQKDLRDRQAYRVGLQSGRIQMLTRLEGTHSPRFSESARYFVDYYSNTMKPITVSVHRADGKALRTLVETGASLATDYQLVEPEYGTFTGSDGTEFYYSLIKPADFDPSKKYPVLIYTYGGPHGQVVRKAFGGSLFLWHQLLAQQGFVVFSMDNRGAWGRGHNWEKVIYRHMGHQELADQLEGVRFLKSLPYVDPHRIGIWGWSYGGYMTLFALTHADVFRTGISVAPVSDWRNYDTIYTERYMGLPADNDKGYRDSSPTFAADSLSGKLLLVHGTYDDNVHLQNSIQMIDRLIDAGKQFRLMVYPGQRHGIAATSDRVHLFNMMLDFLNENLKGEGAVSE
ncbi:MAG: S9 family peptidase [Calditrichaeota bacterium]|nr:MAG: S9 family peptidase [Calditrichota bacterium]